MKWSFQLEKTKTCHAFTFDLKSPPTYEGQPYYTVLLMSKLHASHIDDNFFYGEYLTNKCFFNRNSLGTRVTDLEVLLGFMEKAIIILMWYNKMS